MTGQQFVDELQAALHQAVDVLDLLRQRLGVGPLSDGLEGCGDGDEDETKIVYDVHGAA